MKQKLLCMVSGAIAAALILVIINFTLLKGQEEKIVTASVQTAEYSDEVVKEFIYENYVITEKNPWTDYELQPVEYVVTSNYGIYEEGIDAKGAVVVDVTDGTILYEQNSDSKLAPASTTKLMTALTVLQVLKENDVVTIGEEIDMIAEDSSVAGFRKGQIVTVRELLEGLLVSSGNDAAYILAKAAGEALFQDNIAYQDKQFTTSQCVERFVLEMNKNVRAMELENTNFVTPDGYDAGDQYTSALDMAKIATVAYNNSVIREICGSDSIYSNTLETTWINTNKLMDENSQYYYEYCIGMKTGTTDLAGNCLVSAAKKDDKVYISVLLNEETEEKRWADTVKLLRYAME